MNKKLEVNNLNQQKTQFQLNELNLHKKILVTTADRIPIMDLVDNVGLLKTTDGDVSDNVQRKSWCSQAFQIVKVVGNFARAHLRSNGFKLQRFHAISKFLVVRVHFLNFSAHNDYKFVLSNFAVKMKKDMQ